MSAAVFSFELEAFETACATASDCTFDKADYVPYAFGFYWQDDGSCDGELGPYIIQAPGGPLPFDGLFWNGNVDPAALNLIENVAINSSDYLTYDSPFPSACEDFQFLDGCFAELIDADGYRLAFSLLSSTTGLEDGTDVDLFFLWGAK